MVFEVTMSNGGVLRVNSDSEDQARAHVLLVQAGLREDIASLSVQARDVQARAHAEAQLAIVKSKLAELADVVSVNRVK